MRVLYLFLVISLSACNGSPKDAVSDDKAHAKSDTTNKVMEDTTQSSPAGKLYSNVRFRDVSVEKVGTNRFLVEGKGQIFEANFGWVVEDGHRELRNGFEMTDAGAPEWGEFRFFIDVEKERPNSVLTLVLFESSAKDGSRQHELPIPLN